MHSVFAVIVQSRGDRFDPMCSLFLIQEVYNWRIKFFNLFWILNFLTLLSFLLSFLLNLFRN